MAHWRLVAVVAASAVLIAPAGATAATITVNTKDDTPVSQCTLRDAITAANNNADQGACMGAQVSGTYGADTINFNLPASSTITLTAALPAVASDLAIQGPGASQLTVSGGDAVRVFEVGAGHTVSIRGMTIAHGLCGPCAQGAAGGGVYNFGTLTLNGVTVAQNTASESGGTDAFPEGGGILNQGTLTLTLSTVASNLASATGATSQNEPEGGGIFNNATLTLDRSTVSGNAATAVAGAGGTTNANGGGIINFGTLNVWRSTLSANTASATASSSFNSAVGGAIDNANSPNVNVTIDRSTLSGNSVSADAAGSNAQAGGFNVGVVDTTFSVTSSTITGNSAPIGANAVLGSPATVKNTIVSSPLGGGVNCIGAATSQGFNLTDGTGCGFTQATDLQSTNPMLDPSGLAGNGGPTKTIALQSGSPAIDKGLSSAGGTTDQRGLPRPFDFAAIPNALGGNGSDIGAFELQGNCAEEVGGCPSAPPPSVTPPSVTPSNAFGLAVKGSVLRVSVSAAGRVDVADAATPLSASTAKKRRRLLKPSSASGGPPTITVQLRLTKAAKSRLKRKGKVTVNARITFTPQGGVANTQTAKLRIKGKKK